MHKTTALLRLFAATALLYTTSCTWLQQEPEPQPAPAEQARPAPAPPKPQTPALIRYAIDPAASAFIIRVEASGRLAREGTDHIIEATQMHGEIVATTPVSDSSFWLSFPVEGLQVDRPQTRERLGEEPVDPDQAERVRLAMLGERVLDAGRFPQVQVNGRISSGKLPRLLVSMKVKLHGVERAFDKVPVTVKKSAGQIVVSGKMKLLQSAFGIKPLSLLAGSLTVDDELDIEFRFVARTTP